MTMHTWFIAKIRYEKTMENGMNKKVTELYLVDALSFTEAEARIIEEMTRFISGEFMVSDLRRANISEIFSSEEENDDKWYKIKIAIATLNEKSGKEKRSYRYILIQCSDTAKAEAVLHGRMEAALSGYEVIKVEETDIMDVYPYVLAAENEETR